MNGSISFNSEEFYRAIVAALILVKEDKLLAGVRVVSSVQTAVKVWWNEVIVRSEAEVRKDPILRNAQQPIAAKVLRFSLIGSTIRCALDFSSFVFRKQEDFG